MIDITPRTSVSGSVKKNTVFSHTREIVQPDFIDTGLKMDERQKMDGLDLLSKLNNNSIPLIFFDPQYRGILDRQAYGNEGQRQKGRALLPQMTNKTIHAFLTDIERVLMPSGHLMFWVDKFIVCGGVHSLMEGLSLQLVDMITWDKCRMGMGYRTRRHSEYLVIFQKQPVRAKGVWRIHDIPDIWSEKIENAGRNHTHSKPIKLQKRLIEAVTSTGDIVVDPAAGGYSVMEAALATNRHFIGCDLAEI